jgi:hypothetical protein
MEECGKACSSFLPILLVTSIAIVVVGIFGFALTSLLYGLTGFSLGTLSPVAVATLGAVILGAYIVIGAILLICQCIKKRQQVEQI